MVPTTTLNRFIQSQERQHREQLTREREGEIPSGELSDLLSAVALGVKIIGNLISTSGLKGIGGYTAKVNVQGESVHALDEEADQILVEILGSSGHFGLLLSEERDSVIESARGHASAKYVLAFDPVDGSSNLGSNIPVGTIFCIFRKSDTGRVADQSDFLQSGRKIVAAGYGLYGSRTSFVYSAGRGVHEFILDPAIGEFMIMDPNIQSPARGSTYSINEGNHIT